MRLRSQKKTKLENGNGTLKIILWKLNFPVKYKVIPEESEVNSVQKVNTELTKLKVYSTFDSMKLLSRVRLFATPWTVAHQAPLSIGFSRQGYWSGLPFPFPGDLLDPGIEPGSSALQADTLPFEPPGKPQTPFYWPNLTGNQWTRDHVYYPWNDL